MTTGMDLRLARTAARVQQRQLAARLGVSRATVNRYEGLAAVPDGKAERYLEALATFADVAGRGEAVA